MSGESKAIPPKITTPQAPGAFAWLLLGATGLGVGVLVFCFNPSTHGFYPTCLLHSLTGLNCPGCGMTRALYALLHGNFLTALKDNALFVALLAAAAVWSVRIAVRKIRNQPAAVKISPNFLWVLLALAVVFAGLRNLRGFEWLSP